MILNKIKINDTATVTPGVVYDISKATGQSYETLSDALSGTNVPPEVREGGMSVKFIQTSDNKYVQYRLMSDSFSTTKADWQGVDEQPTAGSDNLVKSGGIAAELAKISEISEEVVDDDDIAIIISTDDNKPVSEIQAEMTYGDEESQSWNSDDYDNGGNGEQYAKINKNGIYGKGFFNIDGTPITGIKHVDLYVATDGNDITGDGSKSKPFATIYHANEIITDASAEKEYFIHVADGTYTDLQTKYAGSKDTTTSYQGVVTRDHVHYIGNMEHPENVIIKWDGKTGYTDEEFGYNKNFNGETVNYAFKKCPFHINGSFSSNGIKGGVTSIRGFTFDCKNTRYCLHVEMNGHGEGVEWLVENCRFIWHGTLDCPDREAIGNPTPTIGSGSGNFEKGTIRDCVIINDEGVTDGFRNHDNYYRYSTERFRSGANINIENCKFDGGGFATNIMFRTIYGDNKIDGYNLCNLKNCVGINNFTYQVSSGTTILDWRASVKACEIENNAFEKDNYLQ